MKGEIEARRVPAAGDDRWMRHKDAGEGYAALGMAEEALEELGRVPAGSAIGEIAQLRSMGIEVNLGRYEEAIARGEALRRKGCRRVAVLDLIGLAHQLSGRHLKALKAWRPLWPFFWDDAAGSYGMACALSKLGQFGQAVRWLVRSFELSDEYHAQAFVHAEIEPLLWYGAHEELDLMALAFGHPAFARAMATATSHRGEIRMDALQLEVLPDHLRPWLSGADLVKSAIRIRAGAPREIRRSYLAWQEERVAANVALGARAAERAARWILDQQVELAEGEAMMGNDVGARYHTLFLIAHRPEDYGLLKVRLRAFGFRRLFEDLGPLPRASVIELARIWADWAKDGTILRERLASVGPVAQRCGLGLLLEGAMLDREGDLADAGAAYAACSRHWPEDPAPIANRILVLMRLGRWQLAEALYRLAPVDGEPLVAWGVIGRRLASRQTEAERIPVGEFYGQPNLGGILVPQWETLAADILEKGREG